MVKTHLKTLSLIAFIFLPHFIVAQNEISITPLSKVSFKVINNYNYPLTYEFDGKQYHSEIKVFESKNPFHVLASLGGIPKRSVVAENTIITASKNSYPKDAKIKIIKTQRQFQAAILAWTLKYNLDTDTVKDILKYDKDEDKEIMAAIKGIIIGSALSELRKILKLYKYDREYVLEDLVSDESWRTYRTYNPLIKLETGLPGYDHPNQFLNYNSGRLNLFRVALRPLPELYLSKEKGIATALFLTGEYRIDQFELNPNTTPVFISTDFVEGNTSNVYEQFENVDNINFQNSSYMLGLQLNTHIGPAFSIFAETGIKNPIGTYEFRFNNELNSYFTDPSLNLNQAALESPIIDEESTKQYYSFGVNFIINGKKVKKASKRGVLIGLAITLQENNLNFEDSNLLVNSSLTGFFPELENKYNRFGRLTFGFAF